MEGILNVALLLAAVAAMGCFAAGAGAAAAVWVVSHSAKGERSRFLAELAPVRESLGELSDRFDHFYKREVKRDRDAVKSSGGMQGTLPDSVSRRDRLRELRARFKGGA